MRHKLSIALGLPVLLFLASCSTPQRPAEVARRMTSIPDDFARVQTQGRAGGAFRYVLAGELRTCNPLAAQDNRSKLVASLRDTLLPKLVSGDLRVPASMIERELQL